MFIAGLAVGRLTGSTTVLHGQGSQRVFELRTYTAAEGKLADLQAMFRNHTTTFFAKHGIAGIAYWVPQDAPLSSTTLVYGCSPES